MIDLLNKTPMAGLMLVVALGFLAGRPSWRGMSLGPAGGTLMVALALGHLGLSFGQLYGGDAPLVTIGSFGFALFIYSVGFEAGAGFLDSLRTGRGWRMVVVGLTVNALAILAALLVGWLLGLDPSSTAGVLSGALTSAPTYAAVSEVCDDATALTIAFALTYPFGLVGMVLLVQILPALLRQDLAADSERGDPLLGRSIPYGASARRRQPEQARAYRVARPESTGKSLRALNLIRRTGCVISRIHRGNAVLAPDADTTLEEGDHVLVSGRVDELRTFEEIVGPEIHGEELRDGLPLPRRIEVVSLRAVGRPIRDLDLIQRFGCIIAAVDRSGETLEPDPDLVLHSHDVVEVVGERRSTRKLASELGRFEPSLQETDIAIYAGGILVGILIGSVQIDALGTRFALGGAGGLLVAGLVLGNLRRIGPFNAQVPPAARQLVRDLGILLFVAETGVSAGERVVEALGAGLWEEILVAGVIVTCVPILGSLLVGRWIVGLRSVDVWGSMAGGMTSSAALFAVKRAADSNEPAVAYATAYAVSSVLVTMAGHVVVFVMA